MSDEQSPEPVDNALKVFISRIPSNFTEETLLRLVQDLDGLQDSVVDVGLKYGEDDSSAQEPSQGRHPKDIQLREHKGFAFMQMKSAELARLLIGRKTLRGGAKPNSKKKHVLYLSAVHDNDNQDEFHDQDDIVKKICFLWQNGRCPYGDGCKFAHTGEGACLEKKEPSQRKRKCWDYLKGKCKLGNECPFIHQVTECPKPVKGDRPKCEKDCINWKTKGRCRKRDSCPYRHDEALREKVLAKKQNPKEKLHKVKQPLSVRVFGLNYDTKEDDVREFFCGCGTIQSVTFPSFEDSGRSKGYCEVLFTSPKAVVKAEKLHETKLHGRWLSIQAGKMLEKQWEERSHQKTTSTRQPAVFDEFGRKVKQRKTSS